MMQEEINKVARKRRIQAEAMANLGEGKRYDDIEAMKTDDMQSEEMDIFERAKTFEELQKRFKKHRNEKGHLKGNDLRYNIYMNKMNKLLRKDLGLDVESYKDYVHNLAMFAKYNNDYEILAEDELTSVPGTANSMLSSQGRLGGIDSYKETSESLQRTKKKQ